MRNLIIVVVAALALGACFKIDKTPPKDLPSYVKITPGASQVMSMDLAGMKVVAFQSSSAPDDVVAYYRQQAAADGLPETNAGQPAAASPGQKTAAFADASRMLVVTAKPQGQGSMVSLSYKPAPKTPS